MFQTRTERELNQKLAQLEQKVEDLAKNLEKTEESRMEWREAYLQQNFPQYYAKSLLRRLFAKIWKTK